MHKKDKDIKLIARIGKSGNTVWLKQDAMNGRLYNNYYFVERVIYRIFNNLEFSLKNLNRVVLRVKVNNCLPSPLSLNFLSRLILRY